MVAPIQFDFPAPRHYLPASLRQAERRWGPARATGGFVAPPWRGGLPGQGQGQGGFRSSGRGLRFAMNANEVVHHLISRKSFSMGRGR